VTSSRAAFTMRYPARFILVAAMNPCLTEGQRQGFAQ